MLKNIENPETNIKALQSSEDLGCVHTIPDSFWAATKIILDRALVHTKERLSRRDFCDGAKLRCADLYIKWRVTYRIGVHTIYRTAFRGVTKSCTVFRVNIALIFSSLLYSNSKRIACINITTEVFYTFEVL